MILKKSSFYLKSTLFFFFLFFPTFSLSDSKNIPLENSRDYFNRSVLVISHDKIFNDTNLGKAIFEKFKNQESILLIEAEKIEKLFIEEEKELTSIRPNIDPEEFLKLANDFDKRVELERLNQRNKEAKINENFSSWKLKFFNTYMIPIIQDFMKIYEASLVIDIDSKAFRLVIFDSRINITNSIIERMNSLYINIDEITQEITS